MTSRPSGRQPKHVVGGRARVDMRQAEPPAASRRGHVAAPSGSTGGLLQRDHGRAPARGSWAMISASPRLQVARHAPVSPRPRAAVEQIEGDDAQRAVLGGLSTPGRRDKGGGRRSRHHSRSIAAAGARRGRRRRNPRGYLTGLAERRASRRL